MEGLGVQHLGVPILQIIISLHTYIYICIYIYTFNVAPPPLIHLLLFLVLENPHY